MYLNFNTKHQQFKAIYNTTRICSHIGYKINNIHTVTHMIGAQEYTSKVAERLKGVRTESAGEIANYFHKCWFCTARSLGLLRLTYENVGF